MGYQLADSIEVLDEFVSIGGLRDFRNWAEQQGPPLNHFIEHGWTEDLDELAKQCKEANPPAKVAEQVRVLGECAARAHDIIILTDGMMDPRALIKEKKSTRRRRRV